MTNKPFPIKKILIAVIIILVAVLSFFDMKESLEKTHRKWAEEAAASTQLTTRPTTQAAPEYKKVELETLFSEVQSDTAAAEAKYKDKYITTEGTVAMVDNDSNFICIGIPGKGYMFNVLYLTAGEKILKDQKIEEGNKLTIQCHISEVNEMIGFSGELISILSN